MKCTYLMGVTVILLSVFGLTVLAGPVMAQRQDSSSVRNLLEERDREIKELLGDKGTTYSPGQRDKLKNIINGIIDYRAMARHALQETYDTLGQPQRDEFVNLFSTIIRDQSLNKLDIYRAEVSYRSIKVNGDTAVVETMATLENVRTPVTYKMELEEGENRWVVTDMVIDDVSTAGSYRRQFQRIISNRGYDSLLEILRERASKS